jgi:hypothetical protein
MQALHEYERDRLPKTAEIVRLNRKGGPERATKARSSPPRDLNPSIASSATPSGGDRQGLRQQSWLHAEPGQ